MNLENASTEQLAEWEAQLAKDYAALQQESLKLDLTRGKPSTQQLSLSDALDGILDGNYMSEDGTDVRNYGGLDGLIEARRLGGELLGVPVETVIAGGNSSLTLMYQAVSFAKEFGLKSNDQAWKDIANPKFLCPVPGYDRHFTICERLNIEMINVPMLSDGPDMDVIEAKIKADPSIIGIWCVPKYSNPTGVIYSDATVERMAQLGKIANPAFRIFWDNAYAVHDLTSEPPQLASLWDACVRNGTEDSLLQFASTSKITHAGAGVAFMAASTANLTGFKKSLEAATIGPDKINQLRHLKLLPNLSAVTELMAKHAEFIKPRFETVLEHLEAAFTDSDLGSWESPVGGYFISFDTQPGCAREVVKLASDAGVKLTPAGATFPYGKDPDDANIRLAPSVPSVPELNKAMQVFTICVKLASVRAKLNQGG